MQRQVGGGGILLGGRTILPLCDGEQGSPGRLCVLWPSSDGRCPAANPVSRVRLLWRERQPYHLHHSESFRRDETSRKNVPAGDLRRSRARLHARRGSPRCPAGGQQGSRGGVETLEGIAGQTVTPRRRGQPDPERRYFVCAASMKTRPPRLV